MCLHRGIVAYCDTINFLPGLSYVLKNSITTFYGKHDTKFKSTESMKPPPFEYIVPSTLDEAVSALTNEDAMVLAGGQSLVPMLNFRLLAPTRLVDINRIADLDYIRDWNGGLRIGTLARHHALETSSLVKERFPVLHAAMPLVAHLAIRNRGTIGGSLCHGDPAAELPGLALLLKAELQTTKRTIAAADFYKGALTTVLEKGEILTEIRIPPLAAGTGWAFEEFALRSGDFAVAAVAALVGAETRIVAIGVSEIPIRLRCAETQAANNTDLGAVAKVASEECSPVSDQHGSADFRRHLVGVLTKQALIAARERAS